MDLSDDDLGNHETIIQKMRERFNAGQKRRVWRQFFTLNKQQANVSAYN